MRIGELLLGARHLALHAMEEGEVVEEAVGCAIDTAYIGAATGWRVSDFITNDIVRRAVEDEGNPRLHVRYLLCLSRVVRGEGDAVLRAMEIAREEKMPGCEGASTFLTSFVGVRPDLTIAIQPCATLVFLSVFAMLRQRP